MALGANLLLGLSDDRGGLVGNLAANLVEELLVSVLAGQVGDALELRGLLGAELLKLAGTLLDLKENIWNNFGSKVPENAVFSQIFYDKNCQILALNFGKGGYLVTMTEGQAPVCEKNGKVL